MRTASRTTNGTCPFPRERDAHEYSFLENEKTGRGRFFHPNGQRTESLRTGLSSPEIIVQVGIDVNLMMA